MPSDDRQGKSNDDCQVRRFENADELTREDIDMDTCTTLERTCKRKCRKSSPDVVAAANCTTVEEEVCEETTSQEECKTVDKQVCEDFEEEVCDGDIDAAEDAAEIGSLYSIFFLAVLLN